MDIEFAALVLSAYKIAKPFLEKTGEGVARKVGEDIWNLIKKPFIDKKGNDAKTEEISESEFSEILTTELKNNPDLVAQLNKIVEEANVNFTSGNQNISNNAEIQKQLNINSNTGSINF